MAKQRIDREQVITRAVELVDADGIQDLLLSRVADELGVQSSALYNHVNGLDGLKSAITSRSADNLAGSLRDAAVGRSGDQAVRAVAAAYRAFAIQHPGQYASTIIPPRDVDTSADSPSLILDVLARILETYGFEDDKAVHLARIIRSAVHGFVALEANNAFTSPQDLDDSFAELVNFVVRGLNNIDTTDATT